MEYSAHGGSLPMQIYNVPNQSQQFHHVGNAPLLGPFPLTVHTMIDQCRAPGRTLIQDCGQCLRLWSQDPEMVSIVGRYHPELVILTVQ